MSEASGVAPQRVARAVVGHNTLMSSKPCSWAKWLPYVGQPNSPKIFLTGCSISHVTVPSPLCYFQSQGRSDRRKFSQRSCARMLGAVWLKTRHTEPMRQYVCCSRPSARCRAAGLTLWSCAAWSLAPRYFFILSMNFAKAASCTFTAFLVPWSVSSSEVLSNLLAALPTNTSGVPKMKAFRNVIDMRQ
jgi:hypothetical protein